MNRSQSDSARSGNKLSAQILRVLSFVAAAGVAVAYWAATRPIPQPDFGSGGGGEDIEPREPADFSLPGRDGREVRLGEYKGRPVLVNFWATWCPPCTEELPTLLKFADWARKTLGLEVLAVSVDEGWDAVDTMFREKKFWPGKELPFTILLSPGAKGTAEAAASFGVQKYPETFFINRDFKVVRKFAGAQNWLSEEMIRWATENSK